MTIERLDLERIKEIVEFDLLCFPNDYWNEGEWEELLSDDRSIYYGLLDNDKLVGDIFIYNWQGEKDYIKIMNLAVHPDYRKQGWAHKLLHHAEKEMLNIGMNRFCGETRESNKAMQNVFEGCDYRLDRVEENYYDKPDESAYKYVLQR